MNRQVSKDILIEELIDIIPGSITYLMNKGIKCYVCGEPMWGTLEAAARDKGFSNDEIDEFVFDLNNLSIPSEAS